MFVDEDVTAPDWTPLRAGARYDAPISPPEGWRQEAGYKGSTSSGIMRHFNPDDPKTSALCVVGRSAKPAFMWRVYAGSGLSGHGFENSVSAACAAAEQYVNEHLEV